jgi:mannose-6-phosphate isomerase-like protein (cupin superfamily)
VPPGTDFVLTNTGTEPLRVLACMQVAGQARIDGKTQTLPWMQ